MEAPTAAAAADAPVPVPVRVSAAASLSKLPAVVPDGFLEDARTMRERMIAGDLYLAEDPELAIASRRAYQLQKKHESAYGESIDAGYAVLKEMFAECGEGVHIKPPFVVDYGSNIRMGRGSFANFGFVALDVCPITIGEDVLIGTNVQLLTPIHPLDPQLRRAHWQSAKPITIEDNVWIGSGAIVLPGVTIGANSVIGAGAVVTKSIPANSVALGNPARIIKTLEQGETRPEPQQAAEIAAGAGEKQA